MKNWEEKEKVSGKNYSRASKVLKRQIVIFAK